MLNTSSHPRRIFAYAKPTDMRKSFHGLLVLVQQVFGEHDPYSGSLFLFVNRKSNYVKILSWDRTGFVLFKLLRKSDEYKEIPVIMLTGVADSLSELDAKKDDTFESPYDKLRESLRKNIQEMREEGLVKPEMYIDKPIDLDDLAEKVKELIGN